MSGFPKALLASTDSVILDYIASKEILHPLTISKTSDHYLLKMNDVTNPQSPSYRFLKKYYEQGIRNLNSCFKCHNNLVSGIDETTDEKPLK